MVSEEMAGDRVILWLEGTFDAAESWRVHDTLGKLERGTQITLDFSQVRSFHDFAIALLAQDLQSAPGRVTTRGLCQHQHRILRYFGVDADHAEDATGAYLGDAHPGDVA